MGGVLKGKKGQGLPMTEIILAIIVLIVLVVLVLIFTGKIGEWRIKTEDIGNIEKFAGGESDVGGACLLDDGDIGSCQSSCEPPALKVGKQALRASKERLCKFGLVCCTFAGTH